MAHLMATCQCSSLSSISPPSSLRYIIAGFGMGIAVGNLATLMVFGRKHMGKLMAGINVAMSLLRSPKTDRDIAIDKILAERLFHAGLYTNDTMVMAQLPMVALLVAAASFFEFFPNDLMWPAAYIMVLSLIAYEVFCFAVPMLRSPFSMLFMAGTICVGTAIPQGFATTPDGYYFAVCMARCCWLLCCVGAPPMKLWLPLNALNLAWQIAVILVSPGLHEVRGQNIFLAVMTTSWCIIAGFAGGALSLDAAKALINALQATHNESIVRALLNLICDAFVAMRDDFALVESSPRLAALLIGNPTVTGRKGQDFTSLLMSHDVARFEQFVRGATEATGQLQVDLRDSTGQKVSVLIYRVGLKDPIDGTLTHFMGIVEDTHAERSAGLTNTIFREMPESALAMAYNVDKEENISDASDDEASVISDAENFLQGKSGKDDGASVVSRGSRTSKTSNLSGPVSVSAWATKGQKASVTLKTWLQLEVVAESEQSRRIFSFSEAKNSPDQFFSRFSEDKHFQRWLEYVHTIATHGANQKHPKFDKGVISSMGSSLTYKAEVEVDILESPRDQGPPKLQAPDGVSSYDPRSRFVLMQLHITPPHVQSKKKKKHRSKSGQRGAQSAAWLSAAAAVDGPSTGAKGTHITEI